MPECAHCGREWSYKDTLKRTFRMKMSCPYCNEGNYHSARGRIRSTILPVVLTPILMFLVIFFDLSVLWSIGISLILIVILLSIIPFYIDLSKEEEPLW